MKVNENLHEVSCFRLCGCGLCPVSLLQSLIYLASYIYHHLTVKLPLKRQIINWQHLLILSSNIEQQGTTVGMIMTSIETYRSSLNEGMQDT